MSDLLEGTVQLLPSLGAKKEVGRRVECRENFKGFLVRANVFPVAATPWESRDQPLQEGVTTDKRKEARGYPTSITSFSPVSDGES